MLYNQHGVKSINTFDNYYFNLFERIVVFFRHFYLSAATIFLVNPHIDKGHLHMDAIKHLWYDQERFLISWKKLRNI